MCAETFRTGEPYGLAGHRIVFANWHYVRPCEFEWRDAAGKRASLFSEMSPEEAHIVRHGWPRGVQIVASPALRTGPILRRDQPWEDGSEIITTLIQEQGRYRAWATMSWGDLKGRGQPFFCYYESVDGLRWERPNCGIIEYRGNRDNNLLLAEAGGTVFRDPSAVDEERYKWVECYEFGRAAYEEYCRRRPSGVGHRAYRTDMNVGFGMRGAVSPDGIRWAVIPEPLVMTHTDTQTVAYYDTALKKYVCYFRDWMVGPQADSGMDEEGLRWLSVGRRAIGRSETEDFRQFPLPELIVEPGPEMNPSEVFYTNCRTSVPGAPDVHLMFPAVWNTATDATDIRLFSSRDGQTWHSVPGNPVLETAEFGQWDGGCVFASPNLIELPNGDFALPYAGYDVPHKYPRAGAKRSTGYALWPKGRMVAMESAEKGEFATVALIPPGNKLLINALTKRSGYVLVEALNFAGEVIQGRDFANAVPIVGDCYRTAVVWKGHDDLGIAPGQAVLLRFRLQQASIFGLEFIPVSK